jgi:hypothetical protein
LRAEQPNVVVDAPAVAETGTGPDGEAAETSVAESTDDKLTAIAADFDRDEPVRRELADSDTDTFARVASSEDESGVPAQHRTGLRALADRAMGR